MCREISCWDMKNPANVKGTDLSSSYFPVGAAFNGVNIEVSTSLLNIVTDSNLNLHQKAMVTLKMAIVI